MTLTDSRDATTITSPTTLIDRLTALEDIVGLAFKQLTLERHPFVRSFRIERPVAPSDLIPDDLTVQRCVTHETGVVVLAHDSHGSLLIRGFARSTIVSVAASDASDADELEAKVRSCVPQTSTPGEVPIRTWHANRHGNYRSADRSIAAPDWPSIQANYPGAARQDLSELMAVARPIDGGKLILWHGEPGTGKTTALRALMREWVPWCASQYIADPERFFADPGYLSEVLTRPNASVAGPTFSTAGEPDAQWRLVVAEDSDEYLRASARRDAGAGLGRLLNLADGVLGQGFNTLILLTTNEELHRIHPALTRPGRCLARVGFPRFSPAEARSWLPDDCPAPGQALTLAEMYEHAGELGRIGDHRTEPRAIGQYL